MKVTANGVHIECIQGDITQQADMEAIVNAANKDLVIGGGVAGAIHRAAGPELEKVCKPLGPIDTGQVVITDAFDLPNRKVIHALGPVYWDEDEPAKLLAACYRNALDLAEKEGLTSIAFPALSTGAFGYPMEAAADVAFATVIAKSKDLKSVKKIRWVLFSDADLAVHRRFLDQLWDQVD